MEQSNSNAIYYNEETKRTDIRIPDEIIVNLLPDSKQELKEICYSKVNELYGNELPEPVKSHLDKELEVISKYYSASLYMIGHKLIKHSENNGYHVIAQGPLGSSLAAFLSGISNVNPLAPHYRCPKCCYSEFITDGSVRSGFDLPLKNCPKCGADMIGDGQDIPLETLMGLDGDRGSYIGLNIAKEFQQELIHYAEKLLDLENYNIDDSLMEIGLVSHDFLTLYKHLEDLTEIKISDVPTSDPLVYKLFTSTEPLNPDQDTGMTCGTLGIPEFGTEYVMNILAETQPKTFSDLIQIAGLFYGTGLWFGNAQDLIKSGICTISDIIGTRDDIMLYLTHKGIDLNLAYRIMEITRKGKAERLFDDKIHQELREYDIPEWYIESCKNIKYLLPKAYAVEYATAAVKLAWFKIYRPVEFYAAVLTTLSAKIEPALTKPKNRKAVIQEIIMFREHDGIYGLNMEEKNTLETLRIVLELMSRGIEILPVDIMKSDAVAYTIEDGNIRLPLYAVSDCEINDALKIKEAVESGSCTNIDEIQQKSGVSKWVIDRLQSAGAFKKFLY